MAKAADDHSKTAVLKTNWQHGTHRFHTAENAYPDVFCSKLRVGRDLDCQIIQHIRLPAFRPTFVNQAKQSGLHQVQVSFTKQHCLFHTLSTLIRKNYHLIHPPTPSVTNRPVARLSPLVLKKCISLALKNSLRITIRSQSFIFEHKPSAWSATNSP
ncbi:hypothetical protein PGT21_036469 [Puccinia graminis f. sp. tritici]|uniref:Uncharacterized protein n=1 Tax=Puccinia graminis f. sp. tritici TaxID=56615 RepID=A0A5B0NEL2_PUCGR|nr:hypothetical protein PGT21_036469 [Puccinia graminis f. sp. tritici]